MSFFSAREIGDLQHASTIAWNTGNADTNAHHDELLTLVLANHRCNHELWHEEDKARREDMGFEFVYKAKRAIDRWNQQRNDYVERMDKHLVDRIGNLSPDAPSNSETPGMIIDRLSILSLKEYHMGLQAERTDASDAHRDQCRRKLAVIRMQRANLIDALQQLMDDVMAGRRKFLVYYQFKMYNDATMNPQLYGGGAPHQPD